MSPLLLIGVILQHYNLGPIRSKCYDSTSPMLFVLHIKTYDLQVCFPYRRSLCHLTAIHCHLLYSVIKKRRVIYLEAARQLWEGMSHQRTSGHAETLFM